MAVSRWLAWAVADSLTADESAHVMDNSDTAEAVESGLADVLQYLIRLADVLSIGVAAAVRKKAQLNETRFPPSMNELPTPGRSNGWTYSPLMYVTDRDRGGAGDPGVAVVHARLLVQERAELRRGSSCPTGR